MRRLALVASLGALALVVTGCAATPSSQFFTLSAVPGPAAPSSDLSVAVASIAIPASVDRPQIVVTMSPNQVRLDEFNRWVSPLQNNIGRVVAENLVAMLGTPRVTLSPQLLAADVNYRVGIEVQTFESAPGQAATLDAVWTVAPHEGWPLADRPHDRARAGAAAGLRGARRRAQPRGRAPEPRHRRRGGSARPSSLIFLSTPSAHVIAHAEGRTPCPGSPATKARTSSMTVGRSGVPPLHTRRRHC